MNANAGTIMAGGKYGYVNSHNTIYSRDPIEPRVELANWVSGLDFSPYQSQAYERYSEGTLLWALEEPEFVAWRRDGGMLWCPGKPGAGKTVFASFIIHHLQNLPWNPKPTVCYIYHRYDATRSTLQLFEAVLAQLILNFPSMNIQRVQAAKDRRQRLTLKDILSILQETFDNVPNIFLVIDAFDECSEEATRHQVLLHLRSLTSIKTLITSRPLPSIEGAMGSARRLVISAHGEDIKKYYQAEIKINIRLKKLVHQVYDKDIEDKLVEKADGRFLLVGLHIRTLAAQTNVNQLLRALDALPQGVTASYEEMLNQIRHLDPRLRRLAFHTLSWISYALRPLSLIELKHALAIHDLDRMAKEDDLAEEEIIISSCAGLVVLNKNRYPWGEEIVRVNFLHYTVQEFLQQARTGSALPSEVKIAVHCMKVISLPGIKSSPPNYPFIEYAASAWGPLVRRHEQNKTVFKLALAQLSDSVTLRVLSDAKIEWQLQSYSGEYRGWCGATAMHLLAVYGLSRITKALIAGTSVRINEKDREGRTPLSWAAVTGYLEVTRDLLAQPNIDVNSKDDFDQTPLFFAARSGHLEVTREFLCHPEVDIDPRNQFGRTPLSSAAINGHLGVVKELLSHPDVDVNAKDEDGQTALSWAAGKGYVGVVDALLSHPDIDVDSKDKSGQTSLTRAAVNGCLEVVKELIAHSNVDVNSTDEYGCTPLSWAAKNGHLEVVELLVNSPHVNINFKDNKWGYTPLQWAAKDDHLPVVEFLLDLGVIELPRKFLSVPPVQIPCLSYSDKNGVRFGRIYPSSHSFGLLTPLQIRSFRLVLWLD